jgi:hypothetical protein
MLEQDNRYESTAAVTLLLEAATRWQATLRANRTIVGTGFRNCTIAPVMSRTWRLRLGRVSEFLSECGYEHGFGPKVLAENGLAHG